MTPFEIHRMGHSLRLLSYIFRVPTIFVYTYISLLGGRTFNSGSLLTYLTQC